MKGRDRWYRLGAVVVVALMATACGAPSTELEASGAHRAPNTGSLPAAGVSLSTVESTVAGVTASPSPTTAVGAAVGGGVATAPVTTDGTGTHSTTTTSSPATTTTATFPPPTSTTLPPTPPPPPSGSGVYGTVSAGPTCPVENVTNPCPPRPLTVSVVAADPSGRIVATTESDSDGRYSMTLAAGSYVLSVPTATAFPRCPTLPVQVSSGGLTRADIGCDTGIR